MFYKELKECMKKPDPLIADKNKLFCELEELKKALFYAYDKVTPTTKNPVTTLTAEWRSFIEKQRKFNEYVRSQETVALLVYTERRKTPTDGFKTCYLLELFLNRKTLTRDTEEFLSKQGRHIVSIVEL